MTYNSQCVKVFNNLPNLQRQAVAINTFITVNHVHLLALYDCQLVKSHKIVATGKQKKPVKLRYC